MPVRSEDGFDQAALTAWLNAQGVDGRPEVTQFPGGASNLTYLLRYPDRELILRRPPAGVKPRGAHDMQREFTVQSKLAPVFPYVPAMVGLCTDESVLGSPYYVMERVAGVILRRDLPADLHLDAGQLEALCWSMLDRLAQLHQIDPESVGLADLGRGPGYVSRQVAGWSKRYRAVITWNTPSFESVMGWLDANQPDDVGSCVIHNDFRFDNLVLALGDPLRVVGVLDWELATVGDPLMDLGAAMAYWVRYDDEPAMQMLRRQPTHLRGVPTRAEMVAHYSARTGRVPGSWTFYEVFGLFRLAVILQQIYYRYHLGQTHNPAFAKFWIAADYLDWRCRRLIAAT